MAQRHNYRNLKVWQHGLDMVERVYDFTCTLPNDEKYGLISQIKRCAVSIPSNIAEGSGRGTDKEFGRFVGIAIGSCCELETQLIICRRLRLGESLDLDSLIEMATESQRMLMSFQNHLLRRQ